MSQSGIGRRSEARPRPPRRLQVAGITQLGPRLRRVHLTGDLTDFPSGSDGAHIKLFLKRQGQSELVLPTLGPAGIIWPPLPLRPWTRTFSVGAFDLAARTLSVDFVLHGEQGPATRWATHARIGEELGVAGPGGPNPLMGAAERYLLTGDLTAVPAIAALLRAMPAQTRASVLIEAPSSDDSFPLLAPAHVTVDWFVRPPHGPSPLPEAVRAREPAAAGTFAFIAGEHSAVVAIRDYLLNERGFDKRQLYATPYWAERQTEEQYHEERHRIMDELEEAGHGHS